MEAKKTREDIIQLRYVQEFLRHYVRELDERIQGLLESVDRPKPGAIVQNEDGRLFRVVDQLGKLRLDTMGDAGLQDCDSWHLYDIVQNGAPDQPWPKDE